VALDKRGDGRGKTDDRQLLSVFFYSHIRLQSRENLPALLQEHNRLLGDGTRTGELASRLNFNYGTSSSSGSRNAPTPLPEPPKKLTIDN
jgi:hypothetical protein